MMSISGFCAQPKPEISNEIEIRIVCSKGTYIRSLAHDIGKSLNSGGHLVKLIRTRIGNYNTDFSVTLNDFEKILSTL